MSERAPRGIPPVARTDTSDDGVKTAWVRQSSTAAAREYRQCYVVVVLKAVIEKKERIGCGGEVWEWLDVQRGKRSG